MLHMTFEDPRRLITRRRFQRSVDDTAAEGSAPPVTRAVRRIVLTGGPGSGKSTAAAFLAREFVDDLWVLPESATLLYKGGMPRSRSPLGVQIAQRAIFSTQRSLEAANYLQHPDRVQLCDRSTIDGAAYWPDGADAFFQSMNTTRQRELARYDAVVFMHSAALLPAGYERDLDVRTEDRDEAIELDRLMFDLYADHPHMVAIESSASFLDKLIAVRNAIAGMLAPEPTDAWTTAKSPLFSISGDAVETSVDVAPISSLMGLASVGHVLPVMD
jgi:predicted ATPase